MTSLISLAILGIVAGALGKLIMPGKDPGGWFITMLLGIGGAVVGGFVGGLINKGAAKSDGLIPSLSSVIFAVIGVLILLAAYRFYLSKKHGGGKS